MEQLLQGLAKLPVYLGGHMLLSTAALALGLAISVPLGILVSRKPKLAELTLGLAGVIQTVPSLALLALMVPLLGGQIGFLPGFIALTLYSILPALSNTITGLRGVDPTLLEAARSLGMNERQVLFRVALPLAAPVIIAGIRTATVLVVGTATLVTPVGGTSLGNYIFQGLNTGNQVGVVFGCVATALLALVMDRLILLLEQSAQRRSRPRAYVALAGLVLVCGGGLYEPVRAAFDSDPNRLNVGSLEFTEQHILGEALAEQLHKAGIPVRQRPGLAENLQFQAVCAGRIDCCVEYVGNIWAREMHRTDVADRATMLREVNEFLTSQQVVNQGSLGFENAYALAVTADLAQELNLKTIADLRPHAPQWEILGDSQIFSRPEWRAVRSKYGLQWAKETDMDPALMYEGIGKGKAQVICAYTSDGRIKARNLKLLDDPQRAFPPYDAVLLLSQKAAARPDVVEALRPFLGAVDVETMRQANLRVDLEKQSPRQAALELLEKVRTKKGGQ